MYVLYNKASADGSYPSVVVVVVVDAVVVVWATIKVLLSYFGSYMC